MKSHQRLTHFAAGTGHSVSASQVHRAVSTRLIPAARLILSGYDDSSANADAMRAREQFEAWCRLRQHSTGLTVLRVLLWIEGFPIPMADIRAALLDWLPTFDAVVLDEERRDELSGLAVRHAKEARRQIGPYDASEADVADTIEHVILRTVGDAPPVDDELRAHLAKAMGLDRAAGDAVGDVAPWYDGTHRPEDLIARFSLSNMRRLLESGTDEDLEWTRSRAHFLLWVLPAAVRAMEAQTEPGFAGLSTIGHLGPQSAPLAVLSALQARAEGIGENIDAMAALLGAVPRG